MESAFEAVTELLKSGGAMGVVAFCAYLSYKAGTVGMVTLAVYKAVKLLVSHFSSSRLEQRICAEMGLKAPLTAGEEKALFDAIRNLARGNVHAEKK